MCSIFSGKAGPRMSESPVRQSPLPMGSVHIKQPPPGQADPPKQVREDKIFATWRRVLIP